MSDGEQTTGVINHRAALSFPAFLTICRFLFASLLLRLQKYHPIAKKLYFMDYSTFSLHFRLTAHSHPL